MQPLAKEQWLTPGFCGDSRGRNGLAGAHVGDIAPRAGDIITLQEVRIELMRHHGVDGGGRDGEHVLLEGLEVGHRDHPRVVGPGQTVL